MDRQERMAYMLYDLAGSIANLTLGKRKLSPEKLFSGFIRKKTLKVQSLDEMSKVMDLWARTEVSAQNERG